MPYVYSCPWCGGEVAEDVSEGVVCGDCSVPFRLVYVEGKDDVQEENDLDPEGRTGDDRYCPYDDLEPG